VAKREAKKEAAVVVPLCRHRLLRTNNPLLLLLLRLGKEFFGGMVSVCRGAQKLFEEGFCREAFSSKRVPSGVQPGLLF
jgi:hypothetical protein